MGCWVPKRSVYFILIYPSLFSGSTLTNSECEKITSDPHTVPLEDISDFSPKKLGSNGSGQISSRPHTTSPQKVAKEGKSPYFREIQVGEIL